RNLSASLEEQVRSLDADAPRTDSLGKPGIHVTGVDRMTRDVVNSARGLDTTMREVLGWGVPARNIPARPATGTLRSPRYLRPPPHPAPARSGTPRSPTPRPASSKTSTAR